MRWALGSLRRLRRDRAMVVALAALVLVVATVFGVAPRLLGVAGDRALREEIAAAAPRDRAIQLTEETRIPPIPGRDPIGVEGERQLARMPPSIQALVGDHSYLATTPRWNVDDPALLRSTFVLRTQQAIESHVRLVSGQWPTAATTTQVGRVGKLEQPKTLRVFEVALSDETARFLRVDLGRVIELRSDSSDRLAVFHASRVAIRVVGTFRPIDGTEPYWLGDDTLARPSLRIVSSENAFYDAGALLSPDGFDALMAETSADQLPMRYTWRWFTEPGRLDTASLDQVILGARRLDALYPSRVSIGGPSEPILQTNLLQRLVAQRDRWASSAAVILVVALGPILVALAALCLVSLLASRRARAAVALWSDRGASRGQLVAAAIVEGGVAVVPAAIAASAVAISLVAWRDDWLTIAAAAGIALIPVLVFVAAFVAEGRRGPAAGGRSAAIRRSSPRRRWLEALIALLAVGGIVLLRSRGVRVAGTGGSLGGPDPFIAAVPVLAGLAAGLAVVRLVPALMAPFPALAGRRRDIVPFLAARRVTRDASGGPVLLVLLATATLASFSAALLAHLDRAAETVAWHDVGAAFSIDGGSRRLPDGFDPSTLPGAEAGALGYRVDVPLGGQGARVSVLALDVVDYLRVTRGTPVEPQIPGPMLVAAPAGAPLPAIVSRGLTTGASAVALGQTFQMTVAGRNQSFVAAAVVDTFPTMPIDGRYAILSRPQLVAAAPERSFDPTVAWVRAPPTQLAALRAAAAQAAPGIPLAGQADLAAFVRDAPSTAAVSATVGLAVIVTAAFAALAVAASLALAGAARAVETTHLRAIGLHRGQVLGLAAIEHGPTLVVALALGLVLGPALFLVLEPGLGLDSLVSSSLPVPLSLDAASLVIGLGGVVLLTVVGIGVAAVVQGRTSIPATLRRSTE